MMERPRTESPYVGPSPFRQDQRDLFFGREREIARLAALVSANPVTLFYGQSGAGKSSVINAGLVPELRQDGYEVLPATRVGVDARGWRESVNVFVYNAIAGWIESSAELPTNLAQMSIADYLTLRERERDKYELPVPRVIIFDQFEELFRTHPDRWQDRLPFFEQVAVALEKDSLLRVVFVMREDYIAELDPFAAELPDKFRIRFRLELLRQPQAFDAVNKPMQHTDRVFESGAAEELVDALLAVRSSEGDVYVTGEFVEPVMLQIVCSRLWSRLPSKTKVVTSSDVQSFANIENEMLEFCDYCIREASKKAEIQDRKLAVWIEREMITPSGTRGTVYGGSGSGTDVKISAALTVLVDLHFLRVEQRSGSPWYELAHDRLVKGLKDLNRQKLVRVFLSVSRDEQISAQRLYDDLSDQGLVVWWDYVSLPARGLSFSIEIENAIRDADRFLLIVGPTTADSQWIQAELSAAMNLCKPISIVLVSGDFNTIPEFVRNINAVDLRPSRDYALALGDLLTHLSETIPIGQLYGVPPVPPTFLNRPALHRAALEALLSDSIRPTVVQQAPPATVISGFGGTGKSTLAAALVQECEVRRRFPDGVIWLQIGQTPNPPSLQAAIGATVFGDDRDRYQNDQEGRLALAYLLRDKTVLIVLDDVWDHHIVDHFPIEGTDCRLLITTRNGGIASKLNGADIRIDMLTPHEGAALIAKRAGGNIDNPIYHQISEVLGGHTLAISLAAAQISSGYADSPDDMLRLLTKRDNPFTDLSLSLDRDDNLEMSLSLSYSSLHPDVQSCFRATGVIAIDAIFDRTLLAAVWGEREFDEIRRPLRALIDMGLLEDAPSGRVRQHRLLRTYARALLIQSGKLEDVFGRYADYIIDQAAQFDTLPFEEWWQLDPLLLHLHEVGDLLAGRWESINDPKDDLLRRGAEFAYNTSRYVSHRPQMIDTPRRSRSSFGCWMEMGLAASRRVGDQWREGGFCNIIGGIWDNLGEKRRALEYYEQALPLQRAIGSPLDEATTLTNIGAVWSDLGEKRRALEYYEQALPLRRAVGDRVGEAATLNNIGAAWSDLGEKRRALEYYEQALPLRRAVGDRMGEAATLNNIGAVWSDLGEKRRALDYYEQALPLRRAVGDRMGEAATLTNIGAVWSDLGEKRRALEYYEQALPLRRAVGDRVGDAATLNNIGAVWSDLGEKRRALDYYEQALPLRRAVGDRMGEAATLNNIGAVLLDLGDTQRALGYYEQALPLRRAIGDRVGEAISLKSLGDLHLRQNQFDEARAKYVAALRLFEQIGSIEGQLSTLHGSAVLEIKTGDFATGLTYFERCFSLAASTPSFNEHPLIQAWRQEYAVLVDKP